MASARGLAKQRIGTAACLLLCCAWPATAAAGQPASVPHETVRDPARLYLPGKYYERIALEDIRRKDYASALAAYKQAAYWANKVAQYNLGEVYFHGLWDLPIDRARGVAWFGIAAESHKPDYDAALSTAYASLDTEQRKRAGAIWKQLQPDYGDNVTLARATRRFDSDYSSERARSGTTEDDPTAASVDVSQYNPATVAIGGEALLSQLNSIGQYSKGQSQTNFWSARKQEFADFVATQFGQVDIGPIEPLPAKHDKSEP
ncbi:MAG: hypothetical protein WBV39_10755 [Rudaea sp.]